ncbi:hypothetical protein MSNKSG1_12257 [Marinobacter santoriniensis NKSG1]|uniref:Uncharacterized protein n=1 Tax=Marinobacter santoriniensis NKSG1 TaxID=1288826 RepID=M7D357_9GAMM|nr:hypothetical protein [Marinobacter santoriniensis]EMP55193.1 hypothetical protein MSNKSG1_12257 [Marinobacter santoriniensis NKSG1]
MVKYIGWLSVLVMVFIWGAQSVVAEELLALTPMSSDQLEHSSGKQGLPVQWQLNDAEQNAMVGNNVLSGNVTTGDNRITDHAFQNMNGIATVIQNTGNQVVIQDSTQINVLINQ